ncbi:hypothetical protein [Anaerobaca lacustris]|uniref:Uncharacterized protein n=1 Tax=Anaerobaca lacustris TaxID=3044600 RepID=A0AAW6TRD6_9BACT|nr:hypothetical protein [Sedimentisphaerales bacterium M17dextr]
MGGLRKLKRKAIGGCSAEPLRGPSRPSGEKLSAVILEFAQPLTENIDDDQFETAITLAILCWNIALLPESEQERELQLVTDNMAKDKPAWWVRDLEGWTRRLVDRKRNLFGHDHRMVVNYTITDGGDDFHLYVVSAHIPDSPATNS